MVLGALLSIPLGTIAAYYERVGYFIMRCMDVLFAFPMVLLAITLSFFMGPGLGNLIIALVVVLIPYNTRVVYVQALAQKEQGYIEAARADATSDFKILFVEMLPHVVSASVVYSMTIVGTIVVTAAGLSFLGLGVQPPTPEWGIMTSDGRTVLYIAPMFRLCRGWRSFSWSRDSTCLATACATRSIRRRGWCVPGHDRMKRLGQSP